MKVTFEQLKAAFNRVLISRGVDSETADACAEMFARTTESGVYSHGVNRFPRFIQQLENGDIIPDAQPKRITSLGAIEQWDAQRSIGNLTAKKMMDRAIELAADHGIGLVALRNANHWMRGGSYGWQAAEKGYYWHLLDQLHRRNAAVGRKRVSHRHQPADRRHSFYPNHHGRYVDVDVLLRHVRS